MTIIDRYLLRQFLQTFVICYLSLTGLYIVFDAFTNLEEFLRCADKAGGLLALMGSHYSYQAILFFDRTAGLLALVSAMFTVSWIQRHNEMTALLSAGISRIRVVVPVIVAAIVVSLVATASRELIIPRLRHELARRPQDLVGDVGQELQPKYDHQTDVLIRGGMTYADQKRIEAPNFLLPPALSPYGKQLVAENAFYRPPQGDRPGGYLLENVQEPGNLDARPSLRLSERPVVITPCDAPDWLKPGQCFVASEVDFEQLTGGRAFRQFSSTAALISSLRNPSLDFGADVRVAIHTRIVNPLLDMTLLFLGLPLVVSRENRNVFVAIGMCVGVVAVFLMVVIGFQHLGSIYLLDPALAAWAPLILFVPPAVGLAESMWQ
ncbi:MAG: LptF/LptG family permease [Pirellulales bacterium]|nr:LptF/LptG family permease [Pirellulales bacterium]